MKNSNKILKNLLLPLFTLLFIIACNTDKMNEVVPNKELSLRGEKIAVCHYSEEDDTWKEKQINIHAIDAHRAHGDAVDMDGDGYYHIENGCGPVDCYDYDPSYTDNCCPDICVFCNHPDFNRLNFGDCIDGRSYDWHSSHTEDYRGCAYYGCDDFVSASAVIFDAEGRYSPDCDDDPSTWHFGYIYATTYIYCGEEISLSTFHYTDSEGAFVFDISYMTPEQALSCIKAIEIIAANLGLENIGEDYTCDDLLQVDQNEIKQSNSSKKYSIDDDKPFSVLELRERMNQTIKMNTN